MSSSFGFGLPIALLLISLISVSEQYGDGAPPEVCGDMTPQHGVPASPLPSPYALTVNKNTVKPNEKLTISIGSANKTPFKGFFLQARDANQAPIGSFEVANNAKTVNCGLKRKNAITHTEASDKTSVVITWKAPSGTIKGPIKFVLTTAKAWDQFWVGQESAPITVSK